LAKKLKDIKLSIKLNSIRFLWLHHHGLSKGLPPKVLTFTMTKTVTINANASEEMKKIKEGSLAIESVSSVKSLKIENALTTAVYSILSKHPF